MTVLLPLTTRLRQARLFVCTRTRSESDDFDAFVTTVVAAGADIVELYQPGLAARVELDHLRRARAAAAARQKLVAVHGNAALAGEFSADVLHLDRADEAATARKHLSKWALIGATVRDRAEVDAALADPDIAYLSVGPVFSGEDAADPDQAGIDLLRYVCEVAPVGEADSLPWFAFGRISADNLPQVLDAGARRVVVTSAVDQSPDPGETVRQLREQLDGRWRSDPALQRAKFNLFGNRGR